MYALRRTGGPVYVARATGSRRGYFTDMLANPIDKSKVAHVHPTHLVHRIPDIDSLVDVLHATNL